MSKHQVGTFAALSLALLFLQACAMPSGDSKSAGSDQGNTFETDFTLQSGQTGKGSIVKGGRDTWTFQAKMGDYIAASLGDDASDFDPDLELLSPSGTKIDEGEGTNGAYAYGLAPADGTYSLVARDYLNDEAGSYIISLVLSGGVISTSTGDEGGTIANGTTVSGHISYGELDGWTFEAKAGDYITASMGDAATALDPDLLLLAPSGTVIDESEGSDGAYVYGAAPIDGIYTLVARDYLSDDSGDYSLSLVLSGSALTISSGDQGGSIAIGVPVTGSITLGELDGWTFSAAAGAKIAITLTDAATTGYDPAFLLLSPSGAKLAEADSETEVSRSLTLTEAGLYTIVVRDYLSDDSGSYRLSLVSQ